MPEIKPQDYLNCKGDGCIMQHQCFRFVKKENPLHGFKINPPFAYDNIRGVFLCPLFLTLRDENETESDNN